MVEHIPFQLLSPGHVFSTTQLLRSVNYYMFVLEGVHVSAVTCKNLPKPAKLTKYFHNQKNIPLKDEQE